MVAQETECSERPCSTSSAMDRSTSSWWRSATRSCPSQSQAWGSGTSKIDDMTGPREGDERRGERQGSLSVTTRALVIRQPMLPQRTDTERGPAGPVWPAGVQLFAKYQDGASRRRPPDPGGAAGRQTVAGPTFRPAPTSPTSSRSALRARTPQTPGVPSPRRRPPRPATATGNAERPRPLGSAVAQSAETRRRGLSEGGNARGAPHTHPSR